MWLDPDKPGEAGYLIDQRTPLTTHEMVGQLSEISLGRVAVKGVHLPEVVSSVRGVEIPPVDISPPVWVRAQRATIVGHLMQVAIYWIPAVGRRPSEGQLSGVRKHRNSPIGR